MIQQLRSTNLELNKNNQQLREQNIKKSLKARDDRDFKGEVVEVSKLNKHELKTTTTFNNNIHSQKGKRIPQKADKKYN